MGSTNHGTQTIIFQYYTEATGVNFGKRLLDVMPTGIYSGGYLTKVSDTEVTLSALVAEIKDGTNQISVRTASAATLNGTTLDSGAISPTKPYLVLRWAFASTAANYVEIHAIASLALMGENDLVIGKCVFSGATLSSFDYRDRSLPNLQSMFLKVIPSESSEMYVRLTGGKVHTSTALVKVPAQKVGPFTVPASPNSRIDLVYIDSDGGVAILQGTEAPSPSVPSYDGRLVLAEVRIVNGDTFISSSRITDSRAFISPKQQIDVDYEIPDGSITVSKMKKYDSGWFSVVSNTAYTKLHGLGSEPAIVLCYIAEKSNGTGKRASANGSNDQGIDGSGDANYQSRRTTICSISSTSIKIRTGIYGVACVRDSNGSIWNPTSAYARIIAIA